MLFIIAALVTAGLFKRDVISILGKFVTVIAHPGAVSHSSTDRCVTQGNCRPANCSLAVLECVEYVVEYTRRNNRRRKISVDR